MAEEPSLPRLPAVSWNEQSQSFSNNPRKRAHHQRSGGLYNSSDPAVFSSDDDPGLDNYLQGHKKKRYVGSWFQHRPASQDPASGGCLALAGPKRERKLKRQFDSGVYLGSDASDASDDFAPDAPREPARSRLPQLTTRRPPARAPTASRAELLARDKVQACLDQGDETIDLWSMGLEELSNDTIRPLADFTCVPVVTKDVAFEQKEPELKIYLAMNRLRLVPGALFDLEHLTVLSLRGNKLTEIPPGIARLPNLKQINVSQNRLRCLPAELVDLFDQKLAELVLHPNPFYEPETKFHFGFGIRYASATEATTPTHDRLQALYLGRSPLQVSNSLGHVLSAFKFPSFDEPAAKVAVICDTEGEAEPGAEPPRFPRPSNVPSLLEMAARSCYSTAELGALPSHIPDGLSHLRALLGKAARQKYSGGSACSRCRKTVVAPPLEWLEWREISACGHLRNGTVAVVPLSLADNERVVPFARRGCSWKCGPVAGAPRGGTG
ncbi:uncharacterized protein UV8b_01877 [Ustilaginoidea virens]|uniref:Uncharacterized protein n=1 Tax=Ustilaginoidea virens TaxID=1159556 RepID=A0A063C088_USTVR|nr:uncharacterized protein UV8b_01877 [Ustilaginoidea virens]QUC17636.1 hypothetical protein UV8b_01877 [Ustilaginoidea virens]GAO14035.1 hypothetical protein UVI_02035840 [Ustilaginoidea virens]